MFRAPDPRSDRSLHMTLRLFVGTSVQRGVAIDLLGQAGATQGRGHWRWAPESQLHLTTLFMGTREMAEVPTISKAIEAVCAKQAPITFHSGQLAAMPELRPSMLWLRFSPSSEFDVLHHALAKATSAPPSTFSPLWPHITLARGRSEGVAVEIPLLLPHLLIDHLTLFRSDPGVDGTVHTPLDTWSLTGRSGSFL